MLGGCGILAIAFAAATVPSADVTWKGLVIAPECRCSRYDRDDYPYPPSVEKLIVNRGELRVDESGSIYGPYSGRCFSSTRETDIEHIISLSEAHDSGLCAKDADTKREFARDLMNLTIASPKLNRYEKSDKDATQWQPKENKCWFAFRVHAVRLKYGLTIDVGEVAALEAMLSICESTELEIGSCIWSGGSEREPVRPTTAGADGGDPLKLYDENRDGRITCAEAKHGGIELPVKRGHPAYPYMHDGDGDGQVCE